MYVLGVILSPLRVPSHLILMATYEIGITDITLDMKNQGLKS